MQQPVLLFCLGRSTHAIDVLYVRNKNVKELKVNFESHWYLN